MKTLEQLLSEWEEGTLTPESVEELKAQLARPEARAELVGELLFYEAVYGTLRANPVQEQVATEAPVAQRIGRSAREPVKTRRALPWLIWHEVRIPLRWALGLASAACLLYFGLFHYFQRTGVTRLESVRQNVVVVHNGQKIPAQVGQLLYPNDVLLVPSGGTVALSWPSEQSQIEFAGNCELQLLNPFRGKRISVQKGILKASVGHQPRWRPMKIVSPQAEATVIGTRFAMSVQTNFTRLEVTEGAVGLRKRQPTSTSAKTGVTVQAGQLAMATTQSEIKVEPIRGIAMREIVALPAGTPYFSGTAGTVVFRDELPILALDGKAPPSLPKGVSYEERVRCYLHPPETGNYMFWVSSSSELWLSLNDNPAARRRIAPAKTPTGKKTAGKLPPNTYAWHLGSATGGSQPTMVYQSSGAVTNVKVLQADHSTQERLVAGQRYYLELVHPCGTGEPALVWWVKPSQRNTTSSEVLAGALLSPYCEPSRVASARSP